MNLIKIIHMICQVKLHTCMRFPKISVSVMLRQAFLSAFARLWLCQLGAPEGDLTLSAIVIAVVGLHSV